MMQALVALNATQMMVGPGMGTRVRVHRAHMGTEWHWLYHVRTHQVPPTPS